MLLKANAVIIISPCLAETFYVFVISGCFIVDSEGSSSSFILYTFVFCFLSLPLIVAHFFFRFAISNPQYTTAPIVRHVYIYIYL